ncbi:MULTISPECIES: hypothetical protein [unclassified Gluconobacter]|nr:MULTISPECIES: hypothetical protein [unclassified Gluconobacter]
MHNSPNNAEIATPKEIFALVSRLSFKVPVVCSAEDVMAEIATQFDMDGDTETNARSFLNSLIQRRQVAARQHWSLTVPRQIVFELPAYDASWQDCVTFVRAPMASGKSAHIGKPFISESMVRRYTVASTPSTSLCMEQSQKYGVDFYKDVTRHGFVTSAVSCCLPSLDKPALQEIVGGASSFLFDEWGQSLSLLASRSVCNERDFDKLDEIARTMNAGVFFDANLTDQDVAFITDRLKPGTSVRIIDVQDQPQEFKAVYTSGPSARAWIVQEVLRELMEGGRAWVSCESRKAAQTVGEILQADGYRVLIVNDLTKNTKAVQQFFADAENVSREYDVVCHSPTITSGLSIEHGRKPHFTRGFFLGGGFSVTPSIAAQMMRRVRCIRHWSIAFEPNNAAQAVTEAAETRARQEITSMTGRTIEGYEAFIRSIERNDKNQRADFGAGLLWRLEDMGFRLTRVPCSVTGDIQIAAAEKKAQIEEAEVAAIMAAPILTDEQATNLRLSRNRSVQDSFAVKAFDIRTAFRVDVLTPDIVRFYDDGRGVQRVRRYAEAAGIAYQDNSSSHASYDSGDIRRNLYAFVFGPEGVGGKWTQDRAREVIERVMSRRFTLAAFGCVPGKWGRIYETDSKGRAKAENKDGHICTIKMPARPTREVAEILAMMGLEWEASGSSGKSRSGGRNYAVTDQSVALVSGLMGDSRVHSLKDFGGYCHPIEAPAVGQTLNHAQAILEPSNEDDADLTPTERAIHGEVRALLSRFNGLPSSTTGTVWLPLQTADGIQKTMTVPVPDCLTVVEEYTYELPGNHGAYFSFPFCIDISESIIDQVRTCPLDQRAFVMEAADGSPYVVTVPTVAMDQRAIQNVRLAYDRLAA